MDDKLTTFLGLPLSTGISLDDVCALQDAAGGHFITFINPFAWNVAETNPDYRTWLTRMTLVLPDGEGVAAAYRHIVKGMCQRISFDMSSLADPFLSRATAGRKSIALIGGQPGVTSAAADKLRQRYPGIHIVRTDDGYTKTDILVAGILRDRPDIVIAGMGIPYQEKLLVALRDAGYEGLAITCGGFFDQFLMAEYYYPEIVNRLNLRFLYRLIKEPRRLWRRYLLQYRQFIRSFILAKIGGVSSREPL